jgi:malate dehydrogenase (oxaloacetate-decarboxylating)
MHDDQHGTAVVVLAGLINALKVKGLKKETARVVMSGAGAAGIAVTKLLTKYGFKDITVVDSKSSIYRGRTDLTDEKVELSKITNPRNLRGALAEVIKRADIFIGVSKGGILSEAMVQSMNPKPIVFALANPIPEIMPDLAIKAGAFIVATGRSDFPNQINNVLAFPGIFRGALDNNIKQLNDEMFVLAAEGLAATVTEPNPEMILPSVFDKTISSTVAKAMRN